MDDSSTGPIIIGLIFVLRCLIPLGVLFGISYVLQRLGWVTDRPNEENPEPKEEFKREVTPLKPATRQRQSNVTNKSATPKKRSRNQ